jgi:Spy/CpxP family protein refolding chaperone
LGKYVKHKVLPWCDSSGRAGAASAASAPSESEMEVFYFRRTSMRTALALTVATCLVGVSAAWTSAQQARSASLSPTTVEEVLQAVRADLQGSRSDIISKNLTLTSAQAAKFWPLFEKYQAEQNVIMDDQLRGIQRYIENFDGLDDTAALGLINAHIDRDAKMSALRQRWLAEFQKAIGAKLAVRVLQIDRRLSLVHQLEFASKIPLVH